MADLLETTQEIHVDFYFSEYHHIWQKQYDAWTRNTVIYPKYKTDDYVLSADEVFLVLKYKRPDGTVLSYGDIDNTDEHIWIREDGNIEIAFDSNMLYCYGKGELSVQIFSKADEQKMSSSNINVLIMPAAFQMEDIEDSDEIDILTKIIEFYKKAYYAYASNSSELSELIEEVEKLRNNATYPVDKVLMENSDYPIANSAVAKEINNIRILIGQMNKIPIVTAEHHWQEEGTDIHEINGLSEYAGLVTVQFYATADYHKGDRFYVDGEFYTPLMSDGTAPEDGLFKAGVCISAIVNQDNRSINFKGGSRGTIISGGQTDFTVVTATRDKVMSGYKFYNSEGELDTGNAFAVNTTAEDEHIMFGKSAYAQDGTYLIGTAFKETTTASPNTIAEGYTAYDNLGNLITGVNAGMYRIATGTFETPTGINITIPVITGFTPRYIFAVSYNNYYSMGVYGLTIGGTGSNNMWIGGIVSNYQTPIGCKDVFRPTTRGFEVSFKETNMTQGSTTINKNWFTFFGGKTCNFVAFG